MALNAHDRALLEGDGGEAARLAMRVLVAAGEAAGAAGMIDITSAHVAGCFYTGRVGLDFAERLVDGGARVAVPTTLNTGVVDLLHPELYPDDDPLVRAGRELMGRYVTMGCQPTWTCAPYQRESRPGVGEHVAWAESNAVAFANSVLGARTEKYGEFTDICAALTGRAPEAGLHCDQARRGQVLVSLRDVPGRLLAEDVTYHVLGYLVGRACDSDVPVIVGLPADVSEDRLKALSAAAAAAGGVALFHVVGVTPEATTLDLAFQGGEPERTLEVSAADLVAARRALSTRGEGRIVAVCLGTPHLSLGELEALAAMLEDTSIHPDVRCYASTSRATLAKLRRSEALDAMRCAGVTVVVDTCTYFAPLLRVRGGTVMTNSAKWAYYAPGNLGVEVAFASTRECLRSAALGRVWHDTALWGDA